MTQQEKEQLTNIIRAVVKSLPVPPSTGGYDGNPTTIVQNSTHRFVSDTEKSTWNAKQAALGFTPANESHNHAGIYSLVAHDHAGVYALVSHAHTGVYEPANANIQSHVASTHAPSNAQKNSDITKAEIENKLIGLITTHSHNPSYTFVGSTAADQATGANVTPISLTGLVFNYGANSKYRIWFMGNAQPGVATTGCGLQFDLSSVVTYIGVKFDHQLAVAGTTTGGHSIADDASVGLSSGFPATAVVPVSGDGLLITGANAGTAQLRFRSEVAAVITAKAGFTLVVEKIA